MSDTKQLFEKINNGADPHSAITEAVTGRVDEATKRDTEDLTEGVRNKLANVLSLHIDQATFVEQKSDINVNEVGGDWQGNFLYISAPLSSMEFGLIDRGSKVTVNPEEVTAPALAIEGWIYPERGKVELEYFWREKGTRKRLTDPKTIEINAPSNSVDAIEQDLINALQTMFDDIELEGN